MGNQQAETLFGLEGKLKVFCNAGREPPPATSLPNNEEHLLWQEDLGSGEGYTNVVSSQAHLKVLSNLSEGELLLCFSKI